MVRKCRFCPFSRGLLFGVNVGEFGIDELRLLSVPFPVTNPPSFDSLINVNQDPLIFQVRRYPCLDETESGPGTAPGGGGGTEENLSTYRLSGDVSKCLCP